MSNSQSNSIQTISTNQPLSLNDFNPLYNSTSTTNQNLHLFSNLSSIQSCQSDSTLISVNSTMSIDIPIQSLNQTENNIPVSSHNTFGKDNLSNYTISTQELLRENNVQISQDESILDDAFQTQLFVDIRDTNYSKHNSHIHSSQELTINIKTYSTEQVPNPTQNNVTPPHTKTTNMTISQTQLNNNQPQHSTDIRNQDIKHENLIIQNLTEKLLNNPNNIQNILEILHTIKDNSTFPLYNYPSIFNKLKFRDTQFFQSFTNTKSQSN